MNVFKTIKSIYMNMRNTYIFCSSISSPIFLPMVFKTPTLCPTISSWSSWACIINLEQITDRKDNKSFVNNRDLTPAYYTFFANNTHEKITQFWLAYLRVVVGGGFQEFMENKVVLQCGVKDHHLAAKVDSILYMIIQTLCCITILTPNVIYSPRCHKNPSCNALA